MVRSPWSVGKSQSMVRGEGGIRSPWSVVRGENQFGVHRVHRVHGGRSRWRVAGNLKEPGGFPVACEYANPPGWVESGCARRRGELYEFV